MDIVTVRVTEAHQHQGVKKDCSLCPLALALLEQYPDAYTIAVGPKKTVIFFNDPSHSPLRGRGGIYTHSQELKRRLDCYDHADGSMEGIYILVKDKE